MCPTKCRDQTNNHAVTAIQWTKGNASIYIQHGEVFQGRKIIITIPPAVLKSSQLTFSPQIPSHMAAIQKIQTGGVIKFLVEFHERYWENENEGSRKMTNLHFLFSDADVPTWWSQNPSPFPLLTGWLDGACAGNHRSIRRSFVGKMSPIIDVSVSLF